RTGTTDVSTCGSTSAASHCRNLGPNPKERGNQRHGSDAGRNSFTGSSRLAGPERLAARGSGRCGDLTNRWRRMSRTFLVSTRKENAAAHAAALGVTGSLTKPLLGL